MPAARPSDADISARAGELTTQAHDRQPEILRTLEALASTVGGQLVGLEFQFKSRASLERKLRSWSERPGFTLERVTATIVDALRYTVLLDTASYSEAVVGILEALRVHGYQIRLSNTWKRGAAYMGINVALRSRDGFTFELQFHTAASLRVKERNHPDYERLRVSNDPVEILELTEQMAARWSRVEIPPDVERITDRHYR